MAKTIILDVQLNTGNANTSIDSLEANLNDLKQQIKGVEVGSESFNKLKSEIIKADSQMKNLNKSIEGLDTEAMAGEVGKFAGGITAAFGGIAAIVGDTNGEFEEYIKTVAKYAMVAQGMKGLTEAWASAQKLLNYMMAMNPIGLAVAGVAALAVGIGLLVIAINKQNQSTEDTVKNSKEYEAALDKTAQAGAENIIALRELTEGSLEYNNKLKELVVTYGDYLTAGEEAKLLNADLTEATDLLTKAIELQAKTLAARTFYQNAVNEEMKIEFELAQAIDDFEKNKNSASEKFWGNKAFEVSRLTAELSKAKFETSKFKKFFDDLTKDTKGLTVKVKVETVDSSKILSDTKSNTAKAVAFEESLAKQIAALRISLIRDEYEQKKATIELTYNDEKENLKDLIGENKTLNDLFVKQKGNLDDIIKTQKDQFISADLIRKEAERILKTKTQEYQDAGKSGVELIALTLKESNALDDAKVNAENLQQKFKESENILTKINIEQDKGNTALSKAGKLIETKHKLELDVLRITRLIKTEDEVKKANLELSIKKQQIVVDLMVDGLEKTKAQIILNNKLEQEKIDAQIKEAEGRRAILTLDTEAYKINEQLITDLTDYKVSVNTKAAQDITKAELDASKESTGKAAEDAKNLADLKKELIEKIRNYEIDNAREFSAEKLKLQKAALDVEYNVEIAQLDTLLAAKLITNEEYEKDKAILEERYRQKKYELDQIQIEEWRTRANEASAAVFEVANTQSKARFEDEMYRMNLQYKEQAKGLDEALASEAITREEYDKAMTALDKKAQEDDLAIRRRQAQYEKEMALTQIAINTAVAISKAWGAGPGAPALIGAILFSAGLQAAVVNSQPIPEYAVGGVIGGVGGGTEDNISIKASAGESIINAKSTQMFKPILSSINQAGGGVSFDNTNMGGSSLMGVSISQNDLMMLAALINDKQVINVATDTDKVVKKVRNIEAKARF